MEFYDLHVYTDMSEGEGDLRDMISFAKKLGFHGIGICDVFQGAEKFNVILEQMHTAKQEADIDVVIGVTLKPSTPAELKEQLSKVREKVELVVVYGGNYIMNRAACEDSRVDILIHPELGRMDNGLDEACLNKARENNVAIGVEFRNILHFYRRLRSEALKNVSINLKLCNELGVKIIICSGAKNKYDMRAPRQLIGLLDSVGIELGKSFETVSQNALDIIIKNRKVLSGEKLGGAEIIEGELNA